MKNKHLAFLTIGKTTYIGQNSNRSYVHGSLCPSVHAEMDAILKSPLVKKRQCIL